MWGVHNPIWEWVKADHICGGEHYDCWEGGFANQIDLEPNARKEGSIVQIQFRWLAVVKLRHDSRIVLFFNHPTWEHWLSEKWRMNWGLIRCCFDCRLQHEKLPFWGSRITPLKHRYLENGPSQQPFPSSRRVQRSNSQTATCGSCS